MSPVHPAVLLIRRGGAAGRRRSGGLTVLLILGRRQLPAPTQSAMASAPIVKLIRFNKGLILHVR